MVNKEVLDYYNKRVENIILSHHQSMARTSERISINSCCLTAFLLEGNAVVFILNIIFFVSLILLNLINKIM